MEKVGLKHRPTFLENYITPASESGILGIQGSIAMGAMATALHAFGNVINVDEGSVFIQRKSQECAHS